MLPDVRALVESGAEVLIVSNATKGFTAPVRLRLTDRQRRMILAGGLINMIAQEGKR